MFQLSIRIHTKHVQVQNTRPTIIAMFRYEQYKLANKLYCVYYIIVFKIECINNC